MRLGDLLKELPANSFRLQGSPDTMVTGITYDSRRVAAGYVFVPWRGGLVHGDGQRFIPAALAAGAAAVVVERGHAPASAAVAQRAALVETDDPRRALGLMAAAFYGHPSRRLRLIGITGTNGKTTTAHVLRHLLLQTGHGVGQIGTIHNVVADKIEASTLTTPQAPELQALLARMAAGGTRYALMEVASHALAQQRVAGCQFDIGIFTNLTRDHLDYHGSMAAYQAAKARLFAGLEPPAAGADRRYAVINADDPAGVAMAAQSRVPVITYGLTGPADIGARQVRAGAAGIAFTIVTSAGTVPAAMPLAGQYNVANALAALAVALTEGVSLEAAAAALADVPPVPGRCQRVELGQPFTVIVDYAHTPDGLEKVLGTAREFTRGRVLTVFGAGGDRDRAKRPLMGATAARWADVIVLTADNPRSEDPEQILREIAAGVGRRRPGQTMAMLVDRGQAIEHAITLARPGDVVVIAGKGHEKEQIFRDHAAHFDDWATAAAAIRRRLPPD